MKVFESEILDFEFLGCEFLKSKIFEIKIL